MYTVRLDAFIQQFDQIEFYKVLEIAFLNFCLITSTKSYLSNNEV